MEDCRLPLEILDQIIASIPPRDSTVAFAASHTVTKTLLSCLRVCKAFVAPSLKALYGRCLYIDSAWRLQRLLRSYDSTGSSYRRDLDLERLRKHASTSLFLEPFTEDTIAEPPVVFDVELLLARLAAKLTRLVIDMPLRSAYPPDPNDRDSDSDDAYNPSLRPALRSAFSRLVALEEFTSVRDELYLSTTTPSNYSNEPPLWCDWPRLHKLALYGVDIEFDAPYLSRAPSLRNLVLTRPDGVEELSDLILGLPNATKVSIVNTRREHLPEHRWGLPTKSDCTRAFLVPRRGDRSSSSNTMLEVICLNSCRSGPTDPDDVVTFCQNWVKAQALSGLLWG